MIWMLMAWLCTAQGVCHPVQQSYPTRGTCLRAERTAKQAGELLNVHCHHRPAPNTAPVS